MRFRAVRGYGWLAQANGNGAPGQAGRVVHRLPVFGADGQRGCVTMFQAARRAGAVATSGVFRPERGVIAMNVVASLVIAGLGLVMTYFGAQTQTLWLTAVSLAIVLLGA